MIALDTGNNEVVKQSTLLASLLRKRLIPFSQVYSNGILSKAVKDVVEQNWLYAVIIGENELPACQNQRYLIKNLENKKQEVTDIESFIQLFKELDIVCFMMTPQDGFLA